MEGEEGTNGMWKQFLRLEEENRLQFFGGNGDDNWLRENKNCRRGWGGKERMAYIVGWLELGNWKYYNRRPNRHSNRATTAQIYSNFQPGSALSIVLGKEVSRWLFENVLTNATLVWFFGADMDRESVEIRLYWLRDAISIDLSLQTSSLSVRNLLPRGFKKAWWNSMSLITSTLWIIIFPFFSWGMNILLSFNNTWTASNINSMHDATVLPLELLISSWFRPCAYKSAPEAKAEVVPKAE